MVGCCVSTLWGGVVPPVVGLKVWFALVDVPLCTYLCFLPFFLGACLLSNQIESCCTVVLHRSPLMMMILKKKIMMMMVLLLFFLSFLSKTQHTHNVYALDVDFLEVLGEVTGGWAW